MPSQKRVSTAAIQPIRWTAQDEAREFSSERFTSSKQRGSAQLDERGRECRHVRIRRLLLMRFSEVLLLVCHASRSRSQLGWKSMLIERGSYLDHCDVIRSKNVQSKSEQSGATFQQLVIRQHAFAKRSSSHWQYLVAQGCHCTARANASRSIH